MSNAWTGSQKKYTCLDCGNVAYFPALVRTVKMRDGIKVIEHLEFCKLCRSDNITWNESK